MSETGRSIVIVVLQYSVVVKGIERKLTDSGYRTSILSENFEKISDMASTTDLFILYLPSNVQGNLEILERLSFVCDKVNSSGKRMILIGETKDRTDLLLGDYIWLNRPIEMDVLGPAIENAILSPGESGEKKRVLIVDDDPSYARMIREWIKDNYQTDIVTAGMQAITFLLKHQVDLILLDYEMPVVDGPQVLQMLRQEPSTAKIPIVFLTGIGTKEAVERVMSLKPDGYILKSTTKDNLLKYLRGKLG